MLYLPFNVYLDSKRVSILIEAVLPTSPMLYLPFNVYLDSKRVSILIEAVLPTLPMLYLPFNVYLDSKRVSILIEAVLPTLPLMYLQWITLFSLSWLWYRIPIAIDILIRQKRLTTFIRWCLVAFVFVLVSLYYCFVLCMQNMRIWSFVWSFCRRFMFNDVW